MAEIDEANAHYAKFREEVESIRAIRPDLVTDDVMEILRKGEDDLKRHVEELDAVHAAEIAKLQAGPKRLAALRDAGVDVDALSESPAILEVLEAQGTPPDGEEESAEWARGLIEKYRLPIRGLPASHWGGNWANGQV